MSNFLLLDCETGGLEPVKHSLLSASLFSVDQQTYETNKSLELFLGPKDGVYTVTPKALEINNISLITLGKFNTPLDVAAKQVSNFIMEASDFGKTPLIPLGHNVGFDLDFTRLSLGLTKEFWQKYVSYRIMDTATIGRFLVHVGLIPAEVAGGLGRMAEYFGVSVPEEERHTATGDCKMTLGVFKAQVDLVRQTPGAINAPNFLKKAD